MDLRKAALFWDFSSYPAKNLFAGVDEDRGFCYDR